MSDRGAVWVVRHDGLWGRTYEFAVEGDSLVGREFLRTDVPDSRTPPKPAGAVRTASCQARPPAR